MKIAKLNLDLITTQKVSKRCSSIYTQLNILLQNSTGFEKAGIYGKHCSKYYSQSRTAILTSYSEHLVHVKYSRSKNQVLLIMF